MTVAASEGILGLEAKHVWNGGVALNDLGVSPRVKLNHIGGLYSLPDADDEREKMNSRPGELVYPSYPRGKTLTYEGTIEAYNQENLRQVRNALRVAFSERSAEGTMAAIPHATYGSISWEFAARVISFDSDEQIKADYDAQSGLAPIYTRDFTIALRMSDGRYTLVGGDYTSSSQANNAVLSVNNTGSAPTEPVFEAEVTAGADVEFHNLGIIASDGDNAHLRFLDVPETGTLTVDFRNRQATMDSGNRINYTMDRPWSTWWDELILGIKPGTQNLQVKNVTGWTVTFPIRSW